MRANLADSSSPYMLRVSTLPDAVDDFVAIEAPRVQPNSIEIKQQPTTGSMSISWKPRNSTDFSNY